MNKSELIAAVAERANLKRKDATSAVDALMDTIIDMLGRGRKFRSSALAPSG